MNLSVFSGAKESSETENVKSGGGDSNASEDPENTWAKVEAMRSRMSEEGLRVDREMSDKSFWQKAKHMNEFRLREMEKLNRDVKNSKSATGTAGGHQKNPAGEKCQKFGPNSGGMWGVLDFQCWPLSLLKKYRK